MALAWNPVMLVGAASGVIAVAFGLLLLHARSSAQNRLLAAAVTLFGAAEVAASLRFIVIMVEDGTALWIIRHSAVWTISGLFLAFAGTFPTPLARPLAGPFARALVITLGSGMTILPSRDPNSRRRG